MKLLSKVKLLLTTALLVVSTLSIAGVVLPTTDKQQMYFYHGTTIAIPFRQGELIFSDNFDSHSDWVVPNKGGVLGTTDVLDGWTAGYQVEAWHPDNYPTAKPNLAVNSDHAYSGKSLITYTESEYHGSGWASDGILIKDFTGSSAIYVRFKVKFQNGFAENTDTNGLIKLIRAGHYDGTGDRFAFFWNGNTAPMYIYDWQQNTYGVRQAHALRCEPQETAYQCGDHVYTASQNFSNHLIPYGAIFPDLVNGGNLPTSGTVWHNQLLGDEWHEMAIYLELNTGVGIADGKLRVWLDGQVISGQDNVPWIQEGGDMNAKWNFIGLGGNDFYHWDIVDNNFNTSKERWYSFDDLEVYDGLPTGVSL